MQHESRSQQIAEQQPQQQRLVLAHNNVRDARRGAQDHDAETKPRNVRVLAGPPGHRRGGAASAQEKQLGKALLVRAARCPAEAETG